MGTDWLRLHAWGCLTSAVIAGAVTVFRALPRGLVTVGILVLAVFAAWEGVRRRGRGRLVLLVGARTFVNNVSLGLYAQAVQRPSYRDAKLRTIHTVAG